MKVIMYMAISVNGMIANEDDSANWLSAIESDSYVRRVTESGFLIIGRRTYEILSKQSEWLKFKDVKIAVVSQSNITNLPTNCTQVSSPKEALDILKDAESVVIAGGSILNSSFLEQNLIDEIYLDIEPLVVGRGIPLFQSLKIEQDLKLLGHKFLSEDEIQLHYQVIK